MTQSQPNLFGPQYGANFMRYHAGDIIKDPKYAITELTANAWDAGATEVQITWPVGIGEIVISDNGSGMTENEFRDRWTVLNYNRIEGQGDEVEFPPAYRGSRNRPVFGRNGVGRHGMFCFADSYEIETKKAGKLTRATVRPAEDKNLPFEIEVTGRSSSRSTGTTLRGAFTHHNPLTPHEVAKLLGSKFVSDPSFSIVVNGEPVTFERLNADRPSFTINTKWGTVEIYRFDSESGRTSELSGIAWWVRNRPVGKRSWNVGDSPLLDRRSNIARRLNYVVIADMLREEVKPDWSGFSASQRYLEIENRVEEAIGEDIHRFLMATRHERKRGVIEKNRELLKRLPPISRTQVADFIEQVQKASPTISERDLSNVVRILSNLELSSTGFELLDKLAKLGQDDLDDLDEILENWSIQDAKLVLNELGRRLKLLDQLIKLVDQLHADELHELQPLFERGLWIFGPEFESISFTSNRQLATVLKTVLGNKGLDTSALTTPTRRPDFVVLPEASLGVYSADGFGRNHEVDQIGYVLVIELKRGGSTIGYNEITQAMDYMHQLRRTGIPETTPMTAYVLGSQVDGISGRDMSHGNSHVIPMSYGVIINRAHQRMFGLHKKLSDRVVAPEDSDMVDIVGRQDLFDQT